MAKRIIQIVIGIILAVILVWFLLRGVTWSDLVDSFKGANWLWVAATFIPIELSFITRIQRWSYIVRAVTPATFRAMFSATQLGFLSNFTIGLRSGEFVRAIALTRLTGVPFTKSFALGTLDRVTDLFGLLAVAVVAVFAFRPDGPIELPRGLFGIDYIPPIPETLVSAGSISASLFLVAFIVLLVMLYVSQNLAIRLTHAVIGVASHRLADWVCEQLQHFAEGLHVFRNAGDMFKSIAWSLVTWGLFMLGIVCLLKAFHVDFPWYTPFVAQAVLSFFVAAPGTPGMFGQFHIGLAAGIVVVVPDIPQPDLVALVILAHMFNLISVIALGVFCLMLEGPEILKRRQPDEEPLEDPA